jgi:demethylmenaquinone methyltransferase/2-methoxy-6-polyprenyl-1,4-benzoquinol methylase
MSEAVKNLFTDISPTYDRLNHFLSFSIDRLWRKKSIALIKKSRKDCFTALDVCAGTHDFGIECLKQFPHAQITGLDFSPGMLTSGTEKLKKQGLENRIKAVCGDALHMPFANESFDVIFCGYGVRNFDDAERGLQEMYRVLKPGGQVLILEFFKPTTITAKIFHKTYASFIIPIVGKIISGHPQAYAYLRDSISQFISIKEFSSLMTKTGYQNIMHNDFFMHVSSCVSAFKNTKEGQP